MTARSPSVRKKRSPSEARLLREDAGAGGVKRWFKAAPRPWQYGHAMQPASQQFCSADASSQNEAHGWLGDQTYGPSPPAAAVVVFAPPPATPPTALLLPVVVTGVDEPCVAAAADAGHVAQPAHLHQREQSENCHSASALHHEAQPRVLVSPGRFGVHASPALALVAGEPAAAAAEGDAEWGREEEEEPPALPVEGLVPPDLECVLAGEVAGEVVVVVFVPLPSLLPALSPPPDLDDGDGDAATPLAAQKSHLRQEHLGQCAVLLFAEHHGAHVSTFASPKKVDAHAFAGAADAGDEDNGVEGAAAADLAAAATDDLAAAAAKGGEVLQKSHNLHWHRGQWADLVFALQKAAHCATLVSPGKLDVHDSALT